MMGTFPPSRLAFRPQGGWRWLRRATQLLAFVAIFTAPVLGGWQRLDRAELAAWDSEGRGLPIWLGERLPMGDAPRHAYEAIELAGGGEAAVYFGVPFADPLAGTLALIRAGANARTWLALALPLLLAAFAGRVFCGWFCPFGTLARGMEALTRKLRLPRFALPSSRPVRWFMLATLVLASVFGVHLALFLLLPHLLLQQAVYAAWLLGGGGAVLGIFAGLVLAGMLFGPTTYCATLCPTGTFLGLVAHKRVVRLRIAAPTSCGRHCALCSGSCWIGLDPASGDPGPDCDLCARCVPVCPKTNLRIGLGRGEPKHANSSERSGAGAAHAALLLVAAVLPAHAHALDDIKPRLVLEASRTHGDVEVVVSAVDMSGVKLGIDSLQRDHGVVVSVFLARGERGAPDSHGVLPSRDTYEGPLHVELWDESGRMIEALDFERPTAPISTPRRAIYRRKVEAHLAPGARVVIGPVDGWLRSKSEFEVPRLGGRVGPWGALYFLAAALFFAGLSMITLVPWRLRRARPTATNQCATSRPRWSRCIGRARDVIGR